MEFGISLHSIVPVRREPSHRSEMSTQLLFGELYRIHESRDGWLRVELAYDNYEGWISAKQASLIGEDEYLRLLSAETESSLDLVQLITNETKKIIFPIVAGSSLPGLEGQFFSINDDNYYFEGQVADSSFVEEAMASGDKSDARQNLVEDAMVYLNAPYLWGGRSPLGVDCSGFTQMVFKLKKIKLLRDAAQQAGQGVTVGTLADAEPGDIAFFGNDDGEITHTGILIDRGRIIHASGRVRIDNIDQEGILDETEGGYTHRLRLIKRNI
jgi:gamma-D-glutamyl-L-lysine dipeptidyl-peptidase